MRVGIDARLLYYQQGGISTYIRCLVHELAAVSEGEEYVLLRSRKDTEVAVSNLKAAAMWTPCHNRFEQIALPVELIPLKIDVLHSPDFIPPFHRRCKSVITVHDLAFLKHPYLLTAASKSYYLQIGKAVKSADAIITVSISTKNDLIEELDAAEERIHVIPEAADPMFRLIDPVNGRGQLEIVKHRYGIPDKFVLFVGTIEPRKNLTTLVNAFAQVLRERSIEIQFDEMPIRLVLVGRKGWLYREVFAAVAEQGIEDDVLFVGSVEQADLPAIYNLASVVVMPSLYEGFGLPVLEAMACGTPVIASNTSSLPEVAGDDALLVDPMDVDEWAHAISHLLNNSEKREDLRRRGLHRARQFSWRRTAQETRAVYEFVSGNVSLTEKEYVS